MTVTFILNHYEKAYTIHCRAHLGPGDILEMRECTKQIRERILYGLTPPRGLRLWAASCWLLGASQISPPLVSFRSCLNHVTRFLSPNQLVFSGPGASTVPSAPCSPTQPAAKARSFKQPEVPVSQHSSLRGIYDHPCFPDEEHDAQRS